MSDNIRQCSTKLDNNCFLRTLFDSIKKGLKTLDKMLLYLTIFVDILQYHTRGAYSSPDSYILPCSFCGEITFHNFRGGVHN